MFGCLLKTIENGKKEKTMSEAERFLQWCKERVGHPPHVRKAIVAINEQKAEIEQLKRERDELKREVKGGLIVLDGLKRRIRDSFEFWPELAMFQDLSNLLNLKPSAVKLEAHNLEQQAKGLEDLYKEIEGGGSSSLMTFILKEEADNYANRQRGYD